MDNIFETILISIISASIVGFINYKILVKQKLHELERNNKVRSYSKFIEMAKGFLNDPSLNKTNALKYQRDFIEKFYNEIWTFGSGEVICAVNSFFETVSISRANEDEKTLALKNLVFAIRKDLNLTTNEVLKKSYAIYAPNIQALNKEKSEIEQKENYYGWTSKTDEEINKNIIK